MFTPALTRPALVAALLAGFAFAAAAQTDAKTPAPELSAKDKAAVETSFSQADTNGDGKVSKEEAAKVPSLAARFDELDKNKDGFLSLDEFAAASVPAK